MPKYSVEYPKYARLNGALNTVFFDGRFQLKPVYLDLDEETQEGLADLLEIEAADVEIYIALVVSETLPNSWQNPYLWHLSETQRWAQSGRVEPPPFTGLLVALALAAEKMRHDGQFSATNYYERLFESLEIANPALKSKLKTNAYVTRYFWRELNRWLVEHDFERGKPTARQVNNWPYVSYALSQALVREEERKRFHSLFTDFDLSPLDEVSESEMILFLHQWMVGNGPNRWLRKLWGTPDLRERLASAAITELEHWDGAQINGGKRRRQLVWTASFRTFPKRRMELALSTVGIIEPAAQPLHLPREAPEVVRRAFADVRNGLSLSPVPTGDFSVLQPTSQIELGALLLASLELTGSLDDTFVHAARPILPLAKLDTGVYYKEAQRVTLLKEHVVLCHSAWVDPVRNYLEQNAKQGFRLLSSHELAGLPPDWGLFERVEIFRIADRTSEALSALVPLSEGVTIRFDGGLRLGPQIWHSRARPTILAASDDGRFDLVIRAHGTESDEELLKQGSRNFNSAMDLNCSEIPIDQILTVVAIHKSKDSTERNLALRDANLPRPKRWSEIWYELSEKHPLSFLSATDNPSPEEGACVVQGLHVAGVVRAKEPSQLRPVGAFVEADPEEGKEETSHIYQLGEVTGFAEVCIVRGWHHWVIEPFDKGDSLRNPKRAKCKNCGNRVIFAGKGQAARQHRGPARLAEPNLARANPKPVASPVSTVKVVVPIEVILDGLCYLGTGSWSGFQSLASSHSDEAWFAVSLAQDLHELGHLDFTRDSTGRITGWAVAPPVLVVKEDGEAFLAGFRNQQLLAEVCSALELLKSLYTPTELEGGLIRHAWRDVRIDAAQMPLSKVRDPHQRPILVVASPARVIAEQGLTLDQILSTTSPVHLESTEGLERFDARRGIWEPTESTTKTGAYRTNFAGRRYFVRDTNGDSRAASHAIAKIFAARSDGVALHGYDASKRRFFGVLGCEPPGLYSRALASCSGKLPLKNGRRFYYEEVPETVAGEILSKLYQKS